jgi:glyoxylase-like metal-dependent hydrolase (beta-lactamase superfamily II)
VRVVSLHADVLLATSAIWQTNCVIVRGGSQTAIGQAGDPIAVHVVGGEAGTGAETFVIDSPILPEEIEVLPALLEQSRFPAPSGLLVTHADWDHLLGRLAFPDATLGCASTTAERMRSAPGEPQRELRSFDERHYLQRPRPLALGSVQALDVPGSCEVGSRELALHPVEGHTSDGMALWMDWTGVLVVGDYLSAIEIPVLGEDGSIDAYIGTLERLQPLVSCAELVVPGHGPVLDSERAGAVLEEDLAYLRALRDNAAANLPPERRTREQRRIHFENLDRLP